MVNTYEESDFLALAAKNEGHAFFPPQSGPPNVYVGKRPLTYGLYLLTGRTGAGKSTTAVSLALMMGAQTGQMNYANILEPRASGDINKDLSNASLAPGRLDEILAFYASLSSTPYVILDSITYLISAVGALKLGGQEDVTMKGGLRRSEVLGVLSMDEQARQLGITFIGTVNNELFPRPEALEGACEGNISLEAHSLEIFIRDRTDRNATPVALDSAAFTAARSLLHQTRLIDTSSSILSYSI
jgi:energy-coupling factor transporter ATP-binding protein EcfA2